MIPRWKTLPIWGSSSEEEGEVQRRPGCMERQQRHGDHPELQRRPGPERVERPQNDNLMILSSELQQQPEHMLDHSSTSLQKLEVSAGGVH